MAQQHGARYLCVRGGFGGADGGGVTIGPQFHVRLCQNISLFNKVRWGETDEGGTEPGN